MSERLRAAIAAIGAPAASGAAVTSDLSIDEALLLHGCGYEPADLVCGVSVQTIPYGSFFVPYGQQSPYELADPSRAVMESVRTAVAQIEQECARSRGIGVVGVDVEVEVAPRHVRTRLTGTAIRSIEARGDHRGRPFATDLSARDFVLLERAGWAPLDLAYGASFVASPVQRVGQLIAQANRNVELTQLTRSLADAREQAMDRMQRHGIDAGAGGIVDVSIIDGPLGHSRHVVAFICYGTAVHLVAERHRPIEPQLVLSLDDNAGFEARSLRSD